jgi:purine nucleosidase
MNKTVIISDPGIDDAIALFAAAALPEETSFVATYGNASTIISSSNLNGITDFIQKNLKPEFKKNISAYTGADRPLKTKKPYEKNLVFIHGEKACEGQFNKYQPIKTPSSLLYEKIIKENNKIDVISLGALTEIAIMLKNHMLLKKINSITFMGGALFTQGNIDTHIEANLSPDPEALDIVLQITAKYAIPLTIVPLDATENPNLELTTERLTEICKKLKKNCS